jgi:ubiquinone/menaquinone biosynthesis C-methylase UbiE
MLADSSSSTSSASQAWDKAARGWQHHTTLIHQWLHDITRQMINAAQISPGYRVLDVAAGAGDQTLAIAQHVGTQGHVLATDISPVLLAHAKAHADAAGYWHVTTQRADAQTLGMTGANFDAAVCRLGLMFCESPLAAMKAIHAALKPGAYFSGVVFSEPAHNPCLTLTLSIARQQAGLPAPTRDAYFKPGGLMSLGQPGLLDALLHKAGFSPLEIRTVSAPFCAPSVDDYMDFLRSAASPLMEILAPLSASAQHAAWRDMRDALHQFSGTENWQGPNELLLFKAQRPADIDNRLRTD